MAISDRRAREQEARRALIVSTARALAEREGWDAVTTRRLAAEIEYSQPVIYQHFASLDELTAAVALDGFAELALAIGRGREAAPPSGAVAAAAHAYTAFAKRNPAVYDAMFTMTTRLSFASDTTPPQLTAGYTELRTAVGGAGGDHDVDTCTEMFWAALHGLVTLGRAGRLRPDAEAARLDVLIDAFTAPSDART